MAFEDSEVAAITALSGAIATFTTTLATIDAEVKALVANQGGTVPPALDNAISAAQTNLTAAQAALAQLSTDAAPVTTGSTSEGTPAS